MTSIKIAGEQMRECEYCGGIWLDVASFERICASREEQSAVLGAASPAPAHQIDPQSDGSKVRYSPCPQCGQMMNRINFARCSGVIVDVCKGHGTWFDRDELRAIVEFVRGGGLELSREREKNEIKYEREQLRAEQQAAAIRMNRIGLYAGDEERLSGLSSARGLLKFLID
jgi:Zn-finger nucleic acid-binding protein